MSSQELSEYTYVSRYAQHIPGKQRRETWKESVKRVFDMHREKYKHLMDDPEFVNDLEFVEKQVLKKRLLGSQRALQYGGAPILKRNERIYNCSSLYINKPKSFRDVVWLLLAGCGVGFSIQKVFVNKLPDLVNTAPKKEKVFVVPDTCEGWADSLGVMLSTYFADGGDFPEYAGTKVVFDYSQIRPKGELIAGQFMAPGPEPLKRGHEKIRALMESIIAEGFTKLEPIHCYDILMHASDFVISGGLRRSATICLFDKDDHAMARAKTGNWFIDNPQRARSNNSVVLVRSEVTRKEFDGIFKNIKSFGEPGFYFVDEIGQVTNPCVEISFFPQLPDGRTGVAFCNLCEINGKFAKTEEDFMQVCRAAAILGTLQAGYTDFPYLGDATEEICRHEALLGVSITGWMDNPDILFDKRILSQGAKEIKKVNERMAPKVGVNPSARLTCAKPAGHTSCVLGTANGIHPHHARRYIRRVQSNKEDFATKAYREINPLAVRHSVWSANDTDDVVSFTCEVPPGAIVKNQINAIEMLEKVRLAQKYWVGPGTVSERGLNPTVKHNISNTITVKDDEWDDVADYIFKNRESFSGVSLLSDKGDLDFEQAPLSTVLTPMEIVREYGDASVFASGLIVDGQHAFDDNLWRACGAALYPANLGKEPSQPAYPTGRITSKTLAEYHAQRDTYERWFAQVDWVRRMKQFAHRYFEFDLEAYEDIRQRVNGRPNEKLPEDLLQEASVNIVPLKRATYCLKHVSLWKSWCDLQREVKPVNWADLKEERQEFANADEQAAVACAGGACSI